MSPPLERNGHDREAGFSLIAAVFLIVVLAALGAFAVRVAMSQYQSEDLHLLQARAQAAAEAGIEYGANLALQHVPPTCLGGKTLPLSQGALKGFVVTVTCNATTHQIYSSTPPAGLRPYTVYGLAARASYGTYGKPDYVARSVTRNVTNAPR